MQALPNISKCAPQADNDNEYAVAWVDQLSSGRRAGRGVLLTGNHADNGSFEASTEKSRLGVPFELPVSALNYPSLKLFNAFYFHLKSRKQKPHLSTYQAFFYPLDGISNWNRLYGRTGLYQHQSVIPEDAASAVIPQMLAATREAGQSSFLTVLKRFGDVASPGIMSFPRAGYTLTVDFPNRGARTLGPAGTPRQYDDRCGRAGQSLQGPTHEFRSVQSRISGMARTREGARSRIQLQFLGANCTGRWNCLMHQILTMCLGSFQRSFAMHSTN